MQNLHQEHSDPPQVLHCLTCKTVFPSRSKLFQHIKESGHAQKIATSLDSHSQDEILTKNVTSKSKRKGKKPKPPLASK